MDGSTSGMLYTGEVEDVRTRSKKTKNKKRRFSDEQIKSLESIFENEQKLEPRKKVEVARELGLQPRQVAIWFQNKRARWKSRQLESDFSLLRSDYKALSSRFDSLSKDKHSLLLQLQKLKQLLGMSAEEGGPFDTKGTQSAEAEEQRRPMDEYGVSDDSCCHGHLSAPPLITSDEEWQGLQPQSVFDRSTTSCDWWDLPFAHGI